MAGIAIGCVLGILMLLRIVQVERFDFVSIFLGALWVFHGALLLLSLRVADIELVGLQIPTELSYYDSYAWSYFAIILVFAIATFLGGTFSYRTRALSEKAVWANTLNSKHVLKLVIIGWLLLDISIFSYWLYSRVYGGLISFFSNAFSLRLVYCIQKIIRGHFWVN